MSNLSDTLNHLQKQSTSGLLNITDFYYERNNEHLCHPFETGDKILLIIIHSARGNFNARNAIRSILSILLKITLHGWKFRMVFLLGAKNHKISEEFELEPNDDVVIGSFIDSIRNLTYKHIMGYKWTVDYCQQSKFILKIDDDVFVDIFKISQMLNEYEYNLKFKNISYFCHEWSGRVERNERSRFFVNFNEYPKAIWPIGCLGFAYLVRTSHIPEILKVALNHKVFPSAIDDNFVTGVLRTEAKLSMKSISDQYYTPWGNYTYREAPEKVIVPWFENDSSMDQLPWTFVLLSWKNDKYDFKTKMRKLWLKTCKIYNFSSLQ